MIKVNPIPALNYAPSGVFGKFIEIDSKILINKSPIYELSLSRPDKAWQVQCFDFLRDAKNFIIKAVPGSGKSLMSIFILTAKLIKCSYNKKVLIITPQKQIAKSFIEPLSSKIRIEGKIYSFTTEHNYCEDNSSKRKKLTKFLLKPIESLYKIRNYKDRIQDRVCITTHANFISIWSPLSIAQKKEAVKNLIVIFDECHHASHDENGDMTFLGRALNEILSFKDESCEVGLMTATYFRNDAKGILSDKYRDHFKKYNLSFDKYFPTLGIKNYSFNFVFYKDNPVNSIKNCIKENPKRHHLIILPKTGARFRDKKTLDLYVKKISEVLPENKILEMITKKGQQHNFKKLNLDKTGTKYHVVICCDKFNEGTDWPPCDWVHNTACGESLPRIYQINGRAYRAAKNKDTITITCYLKERKSDEGLRELLSDYFNTLMIAMMVDEMLCPIYLPTLPPVKDKFVNGAISVSNLLGDELYHRLNADVLINYNQCQNKQDPEAVWSIAQAVVEKYWEDIANYWKPEMIPVEKEIIVGGLAHLIRKANYVRQKGSSQIIPSVDVSFLRKDFDKIWGKEPILGDIIFGTKEPLSPEIFKQIKEIIEKKDGIGIWNSEDCDLKAQLIAYLNTPVPDKDATPIDLTNKWVCVNNNKKESIGRVLKSNNGEYTVRIYAKAFVEGGEIFIKNKEKFMVFNKECEGWILKNFVNMSSSELRKKGGFISEKVLFDSKKAVDLTLNISQIISTLKEESL